MADNNLSAAMGNLKIAEPVMAHNAEPGNLGKECTVATNVFGLSVQGDRTVYMYDVRVWFNPTPEKEVMFTKKTKDDFVANQRKERCVNAIKYLYEKEKDFFGDDKCCWYDGQSILFSLKNFFEGSTQEKVFIVPGKSVSEELDPLEIRFAVSQSTRVAITLNQDTVSGSTANRELNSNNRAINQFIEIAVNQYATMNPDRHKIFENGKSFMCRPLEEGFTERDCVDVGDGKRLMVGTQKSVRQIEGPYGRGYNNPSMVIDAKKAAFHEVMPVIDKANKISGENFDKEISQRSWERISGVLKGVTVETMHLKRNRVFPVTGLSKMTSVNTFFEDKDGKKINVRDYFKTKYNIDLKYPNAPLIITREKGNPVTYPMEVLRVTPFTRVTIPQQTPEQSAKSTKECAVPPGTRQVNIMKGAKALGVFHPENPYIKNAGICVFSNMNVKGRLLPDIKTVYGGRNEVPVDSGKWRTSRTKYLIPAAIESWAVYLIIDPRRDESNMLRQFAEMFFNAAKGKGMQIAPPADIKPIQEAQVYGVLKDAAAHKCKFVFIITPDSITSLHKSLKLWEREFSMVVQDMKSSNYGKVVRENKHLTLENIINKTNLKMGGLNYALNLSALGSEASSWITERRLILGIGMSHPAPTAFMDGCEVASPTVVGYSANVKPNPLEFVGDFIFQEGRKTDTLPVMDKILDNVLAQFKTHHGGNVPSEIIIYRSGVDEGSFAAILSEEIPQLRAFLARKGLGDFKLVFVVVQKEQNVRLMRDKRAPAQNIPPGTIVDSQIAHPSFKEFYLNSHTTLQGSASTPRYSVLVDDLNMSMNEIEGLSYALAHNHQIVALTTSLPAPVYIGNRYAERGRNVYAEYMASGAATSAEVGDWTAMSAKLGYSKTHLCNVRVTA